MISNSEEMKTRNASQLSVQKSHVERVHRQRRRRRSLKDNTNSLRTQSSNVIHVSIRKLDLNQTNNQKVTRPVESILSVRYLLKASNNFLSLLCFV